MSTLTTAWRHAAAAVLGMFSLALPGSAMHFAPAPGPGNSPAVEVTDQDVAEANSKIAAAYGALVQMWRNDFRQIGERFVAPRVARYDRTIMTACGVIRPENAEYCPNNNTIYYDEVFTAGMAKLASRALAEDARRAVALALDEEEGAALAEADPVALRAERAARARRERLEAPEAAERRLAERVDPSGEDRVGGARQRGRHSF